MFLVADWIRLNDCKLVGIGLCCEYILSHSSIQILLSGDVQYDETQTL